MIKNVKTKQIKETATERAYKVIRKKTIHYEFRPGESINEVELATTLGLSRAPIREALNRLIGEGLVDFEPGKGFYCRKLRIKEVENLFEVRSDLELSAIRAACENAPIEKIELLLNKCKAMDARMSETSRDKLLVFDEGFHFDLISLTENIERIKYLQNINDRIRFVRQINLETEERRTKFIGEHLRIVEAIYNRDVDTAMNLMNKHLRVNSLQLKEDIRDGLARIYADEIGINN